VSTILLRCFYLCSAHITTELPDDKLVDALIKMGGFPSELRHQQDMLDFFLPVIRADYRILESYTYEASTELPLRVPVSILGGTSDAHCSYEDLTAWSEHFATPSSGTAAPDDIVKVKLTCMVYF
jgi:medium-chain acyl-[acyl-carrier-protein] hydrolase